MCNPSQGFYGENNLDDEMTKPYLLIAGDNYYPSADTGDWVGCFSTYEEAKAQVEPRKPKGYTVNGRDWGCDWYEIVDLREWMNR